MFLEGFGIGVCPRNWRRAIYSHAITGRDREAARKWEEFQKNRDRIENGSTEGKIV
jgi:hypothetical protein